MKKMNHNVSHNADPEEGDSSAMASPCFKTYSQVAVKMVSEVKNLCPSPACQSEEVKQVSLKQKKTTEHRPVHEDTENTTSPKCVTFTTCSGYKQLLDGERERNKPNN